MFNGSPVKLDGAKVIVQFSLLSTEECFDSALIFKYKYKNDCNELAKNEPEPDTYTTDENDRVGMPKTVMAWCLTAFSVVSSPPRNCHFFFRHATLKLRMAPFLPCWPRNVLALNATTDEIRIGVVSNASFLL